MRVWLRLLSCTTRMETILSQKMRSQYNISLARFDLLAQLERAPNGLTMSQASQGMMVSNGAITNLVDRLEKEGYVCKHVFAEDRRSTIIQLTAIGRREFLKIARVHEQWVNDLLEDLGQNKQRELLRGLLALKCALDAKSAEK